jgi:catechol 2,3-dioxygenase-like lactoylglutathione lyase family enzyme
MCYTKREFARLLWRDCQQVGKDTGCHIHYGRNYSHMESRYGKQGYRLPRLQHTALPISDGAQEAVRAFYGGLLGLTEKPVPQVFAEKGLVWFDAGNGEMEIHLVPDTLLAHPDEGRHICLEVDDLEHYRRAFRDAGYPVIEPETIPHRPRFFSKDPCGNRIELTTILDDYWKPELDR